MTRDEANIQIKQVKRWCRGNCLHSEEERAALMKRYEEGDFAAKVALKKELEEKFKLPSKPAEDAQTLHAAVMPLIFAFHDNTGQRAKICGQDVNELIIADGRFDGETHELTCPKCGAKHIYSFKADLDEV